MPTIPQAIDLTQPALLSEMIVRGGDLRDTNNNQRKILQTNYQRIGLLYSVHGLSVLIRADLTTPATYQTLASRNAMPNKRLSISTIGIGAMKNALAQAGYGMIVYSTPLPGLPDHHDLVVRSASAGGTQGIELDSLPDDAADAIIGAILSVENNPAPRAP